MFSQLPNLRLSTTDLLLIRAAPVSSNVWDVGSVEGRGNRPLFWGSISPDALKVANENGKPVVSIQDADQLKTELAASANIIQNAKKNV